MLAIKLLEVAKWADDRDDLIIECEGYELEPYAVELNEMTGQVIIKAWPPDTPDDEEDEDDDLPWNIGAPRTGTDPLSGAVPEVLESPIESLDISEPDAKEG